MRSANTGISCVVDSTGKVRDGFVAGRIANNTIDRQGVRGWFMDRLEIDPRLSFFTMHGQILEVICVLAIVGGACVGIVRRKKS
ncbi:MAG: hypothetical protein A2178_01845 [Planctomycetes bacterium GWC2_49_10]|nr:MAG: hypothetical protein A2178_01845 [Planctomycetes bacterium GWC2_49_10]